MQHFIWSERTMQWNNANNSMLPQGSYTLLHLHLFHHYGENFEQNNWSAIVLCDREHDSKRYTFSYKRDSSRWDSYDWWVTEDEYEITLIAGKITSRSWKGQDLYCGVTNAAKTTTAYRCNVLCKETGSDRLWSKSQLVFTNRFERGLSNG